LIKKEKKQSATVDKIKEFSAGVKYFIVYAGSGSLGFLTACIENFQHFLFAPAA
jgi:hypothetical protein